VVTSWPNYNYKILHKQVVTSLGPIRPNHDVTHNCNFVISPFLLALLNDLSRKRHEQCVQLK
jgi:hypothetical protein